MLTLETWAIFIPACFALNVYPGPNNLLTMRNATVIGLREALLASAGRFAAFSAMIVVAAIGLGVVLASSAVFFTVLKWAGAAYMVWLGIKMALSKPADLTSGNGTAEALSALLRRDFLIAATNPKAMVIFTAFFAQFIDPSAAYAPQILVMGAAMLAMEFIAVLIYAFAGTRIGKVARSDRSMRWVNRLSGGALVAAGVLLAFARKPASAS